MTALRGLSVALVLTACCGEIAAQGSTQRVVEQYRMQLARFDNRLPSEMADVSFRVWASSGRVDASRSALGFLVPLIEARADGRPAQPQALAAGATAVALGLRYRLSGEHALFADAARVRGLGAGLAGVDVGAKVGVEWQPAKSTFGLEHGALGMQMAAGYKISLKVRHGGPSVYLRSKF